MANSLWDYVEKGWDYATGAAETAYGYAESAYDYATADDSFLSTSWDWVSGKAQSAYDFVTSPGVGSAAKVASAALYGKSGMPQLGAPKGARLSGGARSAVSSGSYKASSVDLGYTSKVQNAIRSAQNARVGSPVQQTVARLSSRPAKGPLIQIGAAPIKVAPRSRG